MGGLPFEPVPYHLGKLRDGLGNCLGSLTKDGKVIDGLGKDYGFVNKNKFSTLKESGKAMLFDGTTIFLSKR